jgi:hypothetical protein
MLRLVCIFLSACACNAYAMADDTATGEALQRLRWARGVRITYRNRDYDFRRVSLSSRPASIAHSTMADGESRIICSVGDGVWPISRVMLNAGGDPGDRTIFLDPKSGRWETTSYHQPRPDIVMTSADGRYVAMASMVGWPTEDLDELAVTKYEFKNRLSVEEINSHLKQITHGTLRYSIWDVKSACPVWEMRFYRDSEEAGKRAKFERPWAQYAKIVLPWWAINRNPSRQHCEIGFSADSNMFAALDPLHGVHVLHLNTGKQVHCSAQNVDESAIQLAFVDGGTRLAIVCESGAIRLFSTESGIEIKNHNYQLPIGAKAEGKGMNFAIEPTSGQIAILRNDDLQLTSFRNSTWRTPNKLIHGIGRGFGISQLHGTADGEFIGIGYGRWDAQTNHVASLQTCLYEVADVTKGRVIRRLVRKGSVELLPKNVPTIEIDETHDVRACLGPDGEIIYVQPLPKFE